MNRINKTTLITAFAFVSQALAQNPPTEKPAEAPQNLQTAQSGKEQQAELVVYDTSSEIDSNENRVNLELTAAKKVANAEFRLQFGRDSFWLLNVSGPFDEEENQALLGDLDRLGNATSVALGFQREWWKGMGQPGYSLRVSGRVGRPTFKYLDLSSNTFTKSRENAEEYSIGASVFWPKFNGVLLALTYKNAASFEGAALQNICTPISGTTASECRNVSTVAPERVVGDIAVAQVSFLPRKNLGIRLSVARDFENDITGIEVPIYLVRTEKTGLFSGGIKLSWQSEERELQYMLFLSQPIGDW